MVKSPAKKPVKQLTKAKPVAAKKAKTPAKKAVFDAHAIMSKAFAETSNEVESSLFRSSVLEDVSGFYPTSLVMSMVLGKMTSGMYVISGPEQSSKSTLAASIAGSAIKNKTLLVKHYDVERAVRASYQGKIIARESGIKWSVLAPKDQEKQHETYRWITESSLEKAFTEIEMYLQALPDKVYLEETGSWYMVFDRKPIVVPKKGPKPPPFADNLFKAMSSQLTPDNRSTKDEVWFDIGDSPEFQAFYLIDSLKAMTLKAITNGTRDYNTPGLFAKAMSEKLPYVKGLLRDKHAVLFCINQMYVNPMEKYGDPLQETGGNAIKLYSDVRATAKPMSIPEPFQRTPRESFYVEPSVFEDGANDRYTFKNFKNIKNKFSDFPGLTGRVRIWSTGPYVKPGICPVFDAAEFLSILGLATIGSTKKDAANCRIIFAKNPILGKLSGTELLWLTFKEDVFIELGWLDGDEHSGIIEMCRNMIDTGEAFERLHHLGSKSVSRSKDSSDSDDETDDDEE